MVPLNAAQKTARHDGHDTGSLLRHPNALQAHATYKTHVNWAQESPVVQMDPDAMWFLNSPIPAMVKTRSQELIHRAYMGTLLEWLLDCT